MTVVAGSTAAATISSLGSQLNIRTGTAPNTTVNGGDDWRSTGVAKPLDADGDNVFGTAGYRMFGGAASASLPTFVSAIAEPGSIYPGNGNYIPMDDPTLPSGASVNDVATGTTNPGAGDIFSFTIAPTGAPDAFRVTLINDNLDATQFNATSFQIRDNGGGATGDSGAITLATGDRNPDAYVFNITGASAGNVFTVSAPTVGGGGTATLGIVAFDVPEPSSLGLLGACAVGLLRRRRRDR